MSGPDTPPGPEAPRIPGIAPDGAEPAFHAPWQARVFALTVRMEQAGVFGWADWTDTFAPVLNGDPRLPAAASGAEVADRYWTAWAEALATLLDARGIATTNEVAETARTWQRAAQATPHGTPIEFSRGLTD